MNEDIEGDEIIKQCTYNFNDPQPSTSGCTERKKPDTESCAADAEFDVVKKTRKRLLSSCSESSDSDNASRKNSRASSTSSCSESSDSDKNSRKNSRSSSTSSSASDSSSQSSSETDTGSENSSPELNGSKYFSEIFLFFF